MRVSRRIALPLFFSAFTILPGVGASSQSYTVRDLNPSGYIDSFPTAAGSDGQVVGSASMLGGQLHAMLWKPDGTFVDLHPPGASESQGNGLTVAQQVGVVDSHAVVWSGTASSAANLNSADYRFSIATATRGGMQLGLAANQNPFSDSRALLWSGPAVSPIDLTPTGYTAAYGEAMSAARQGGYGVTGGHNHALLWSGSATSVVDLHPAALADSQITAMSDDQQVGIGTLADGTQHALLWTGNAASVVDLNPSGFVASAATGIADGEQVGIGYFAKPPSVYGGPYLGRAVVWSGTAESAINLQQFLPPQFVASSAVGVDDNGDVFGSAQTEQGYFHTVEWIPAPEPGCLPVLLICILTQCRRRKCLRAFERPRHQYA